MEAALKLGLPATFVQETSLPFAIAGAIKFDNQAQFHVRKYLFHLAKNIPGNGSHLFENTRVEKVEKKAIPVKFLLIAGVINAQDVIVATNIPILRPRTIFRQNLSQTFLHRCVLGLTPQKHQQGMYIGSEKHSYSIRTTPHDGGLLLLVGGEGHKVGTVTDTEECYQKLEDYARDRFGIDTFAYRWSNQDMVSFDNFPILAN